MSTESLSPKPGNIAKATKPGQPTIYANPTQECLRQRDKDSKRAKANKYKVDREYPSIEDQLDMIYHHGLRTWRNHIQAIKDKYPKP